MSKEKRRVPKLRFPGFTEDWEQRKLSDISTKVTTKNVDVHYTETLTNSAEQGIISQVDFFDKEISNKDNINGYYIVENNDFIYNPRISTLAPVGPINRNKLNRTGIMSPLYTVFRASTVDLDFLEWYFQSSHWHRYMKLNGDSGARSDRIAIKDSTFFDMPIKTPVNIKEQVLIGETLEMFNQYITLHQRKLEHLNLKKKALLQKLFPKNGERYPELRFPGFTDAWEQCKLGSIGSTYTGLSGKTKEDFGHGEAQYITYLNVFQNTVSDITITDKVEIDTTQNEVKYGDVLFTTSSETPEEVGMSSVWLGHMPNIYLNSFCFGFRPNQKIDPYFLGYSLRAPYMRDKMKILAQGISRYNISKNKVMELEISLSNNEEQRLLGNFLRNIDLSITLHQRKLEHLQLQKKALLQQLFI